MKYVLIVGAKSDIALATARKYAESGFDLYLAARNAESLEVRANDLAIRTGCSVHCLELDILEFGSHRSFYESLPEKPVGVVTAVGYLGDQEQAQSSWEEARRIFNTNLVGLVSLLNIVAEDMEERQSGFIVGISSVAGDRGRKSNYLYGAAKAGFSTYLSGLRNRLYPCGVRVLTVKPGFVRTQMTAGKDLPDLLTAEPSQVAADIFRAQQRGRSILYTRWYWRWIMLVIRNIPEWQFKKMNL